jgi:hypothetical protein
LAFATPQPLLALRQRGREADLCVCFVMCKVRPDAVTYSFGRWDCDEHATTVNLYGQGGAGVKFGLMLSRAGNRDGGGGVLGRLWRICPYVCIVCVLPEG